MLKQLYKLKVWLVLRYYGHSKWTRGAVMASIDERWGQKAI